MFLCPCFLLKFGSAPIPWLMGGTWGCRWMGPRSKCQKRSRESKRRLPRKMASEDKRGSEAAPSDWNGIWGSVESGFSSGELGGGQSLWSSLAFLFFVFCSGRSQGDRKSRSLLCPQLLNWGHGPWVIHADEPSHCWAAEKQRPAQQEKGGRSRKGERRPGRHWAS